MLLTGTETNSAKVLTVDRFIAHPTYNSATQQNDIAVIRVTEDIVFSLQVGPACLPFRYPSTSVGAVVRVLGKGSNFLKPNITLYSTLCLQRTYFLTLRGSSNVTASSSVYSKLWTGRHVKAFRNDISRCYIPQYVWTECLEKLESSVNLSQGIRCWGD